ncbi:MAG: HD domain-containing protein, partial [Candidatus Sericytochromatia bacterium]
MSSQPAIGADKASIPTIGADKAPAQTPGQTPGQTKGAEKASAPAKTSAAAKAQAAEKAPEAPKRTPINFDDDLENKYPPYVATLMKHLREKMAYALPEDLAFARKAFFTAYELHKNQQRKSGEPYIIHPYEVSLILTELNASGEMIAAGFLHDILEDTDYTREEMISEFGEVVYNLVDGVTKLSKFSFSSKEERQAENFRRMFMAMAKDIRVVIIKLADRLHNMRTLDHMTDDKQKKIAQETIDIFAPLAHRLGIGRLKWELEDLCLRYLHPDHYWNIARNIAGKRTEREEIIQTTIATLKQGIEEMGDFYIDDGNPDNPKKPGRRVQIMGRPKNFYSIYNKISSKQKDFKDIYDYFGLRVLVTDQADCYPVLGLVHSL